MKKTYTIILDEESTQFVDQYANGDPNGFINRLLEEEKGRLSGHNHSVQDLLDNTPNAST